MRGENDRKKKKRSDHKENEDNSANTDNNYFYNRYSMVNVSFVFRLFSSSFTVVYSLFS